MLNVVNSTSENKTLFTSTIEVLQQPGIYDKLNQLFREQNDQQKAVQEARAILGEVANHLTDAQVYDLVNEIQYLVDSWLEEYERTVFNGKTLNELLRPDKK